MDTLTKNKLPALGVIYQHLRNALKAFLTISQNIYDVLRKQKRLPA